MGKTTFNVNKDDLQVTMERVFDAPREAIWKAVTTPELIARWWGPGKFTMVVDKMDFRVGGQWRFIHKDDKGNEFAFHGIYKEIVPIERVSDTFNFEGIPPGHELVETMTLEDLGNGQTKMRTVSQFANLADLEGMVNSGMEGGATEGIDRLAELVEKNQ
jgi:uncharacterized protein YndB with AHSA1/START domain